MPAQPETLNLENSSLEDVIAALLSDTVIGTGGIGDFRLASTDSRKIFAYYTSHRDLWPRNKQVQATEINGLLQALEAELPQTPRSTTSASGTRPLWNLRRIE